MITAECQGSTHARREEGVKASGKYFRSLVSHREFATKCLIIVASVRCKKILDTIRFGLDECKTKVDRLTIGRPQSDAYGASSLVFQVSCCII